MSLTNCSSELDDRLQATDLALNDRVEVLLAHRGEGQEVERAHILTQAHGADVGREERAKALVDVLGDKGHESRLCGAAFGQSDSERAPSRQLTRVRARVNSVSKRVLRADCTSSRPPSPFKRRRLKRMYQFVSSSMRFSI